MNSQNEVVQNQSNIFSYCKILKETKGIIDTKSSVPKIRQSILKSGGWGFLDSGFILDTESFETSFIGGRYLSKENNVRLPFFVQYFVEKLSLDKKTVLDNYAKSKSSSKQETTLGLFESPIPASLLSGDKKPKVLAHLDKLMISYSLQDGDRLFRSHGHSLEDICNMRNGEWGRLPDIILWPKSHSNVEDILEFAKKFDLAVIPYGGGTSVTEALRCEQTEERPIVSLDMSQMNRILSIDEENLTCCAEAGITGQDIERELKAKGYTLGHEPDSYEFSTLGGWVATRASGMKKNMYGNIEDIVLHMRMVSPSGTVEKFCGSSPRISAGCDIHHFILGSEGTLGVITEVTVKIRPLPKCRRYGSIVFPEFSQGIKCLREIAKQRCQPASIRLMDHEQFQFGHAIRPQPTYFEEWKECFKMFYLTKWQGFDLEHICVATLLFEGDEVQVSNHETKIYSIASTFKGIPGGETNGERGYNLTFVIAYIRDLALDIGVYAESFETSVPWNKAYILSENVKIRIKNECTDRGLTPAYLSCRVTQTYDSGVCVYFYMAINGQGLLNPMTIYNELEIIARDEILLNGGSISHHHGVGKIRKRWLPQTISHISINALRSVKRTLDPNNILACGNLLFPQEKELYSTFNPFDDDDDDGLNFYQLSKDSKLYLKCN